MISRLRVSILLALLVSVHGAQAAGRDGNTWGQLNASEKLNYVAGFFDGVEYGQVTYTGALLTAMADPKNGKFDAKRAEVAKAAGAQANQRLEKDFGGVTAGQLVAGLDKVYADYRNTRIGLGDALTVVIRSINGASDDSINQLLESKRAAAGHD